MAAFEVESDITLVLPRLQIVRPKAHIDVHIGHREGMDLYLDPYIFMCHLHLVSRLINEAKVLLFFCVC